MSVRDRRAACTERWGSRPSPSASLGGPGCLPGSASAWTYAAVLTAHGSPVAAVARDPENTNRLHWLSLCNKKFLYNEDYLLK